MQAQPGAGGDVGALAGDVRRPLEGERQVFVRVFGAARGRLAVAAVGQAERARGLARRGRRLLTQSAAALVMLLFLAYLADRASRLELGLGSLWHGSSKLLLLLAIAIYGVQPSLQIIRFKWMLNLLAVVRQALGSLDRFERIVKLLGLVASAPGFNTLPDLIAVTAAQARLRL